MNTLLAAARRYVAAGLSVIPIKTDGSKAPAVSWKPYQKRLPTDQELQQWFGADQPVGMAVVCGGVSGNLEVLDFDEPGLFEEHSRALAGWGLGRLLEGLPVVETPSGGRHVYYRVSGKVAGSQQLAKTRGGKIRIETRGEGGCAIAPPSPAECHPDKRPYRLLSGELCNIPTRSGEDAELLRNIASVFFDASPPPPAREEASPLPRRSGLSPGDDYKARGDVLSVLQRHGWEVVGRHEECVLLRRPGKGGHGVSASWNHGGHACFVNFSSSVPQFDTNRGYSAFAVYAILEHGGNFSAAARDLAEDGYGDTAFTATDANEKSSAGGTNQATKRTSHLPDLPGRECSFREWAAAGKKAAKWRQTAMDDFRWWAGDWWNIASPSLDHGQKIGFLERQFGKPLAAQIRKAATVAGAWPEAERTGPYWLHEELVACPDEIRSQWVTTYHERLAARNPLTRGQLREGLGSVPVRREPKGWRRPPAAGLPESLADALADAANEYGAEVIAREVRAFLARQKESRRSPSSEKNAYISLEHRKSDTEDTSSVQANIQTLTTGTLTFDPEPSAPSEEMRMEENGGSPPCSEKQLGEGDSAFEEAPGMFRRRNMCSGGAKDESAFEEAPAAEGINYENESAFEEDPSHWPYADGDEEDPGPGGPSPAVGGSRGSNRGGEPCEGRPVHAPRPDNRGSNPPLFHAPPYSATPRRGRPSIEGCGDVDPFMRRGVTWGSAHPDGGTP